MEIKLRFVVETLPSGCIYGIVKFDHWPCAVHFGEAEGRSKSKGTLSMAPVINVSVSKKTKGSPSGKTESASILFPQG